MTKRKTVLALALFSLVLAGCDSTRSPEPRASTEMTPTVTVVSPPPSPDPSPVTVCHPVPAYFKGVWSPSLTCGSAVAAALAALPPNHPAIVRIEFQFGDYCPGGCSALNLLDGYVIVTFVDGSSLLVSVRNESPTSGVHVTSVGPLATQPAATRVQ